MVHRSGLRKRIGEYVVCQLENVAVRGILVGVHRDVLELADPAELTEGGEVVLDQRALIPRERISYVQVGPATTKDAG